MNEPERACHLGLVPLGRVVENWNLTFRAKGNAGHAAAQISTILDFARHHNNAFERDC